MFSVYLDSKNSKKSKPQMPAAWLSYLIKSYPNYYLFMYFKKLICKPLALKSIRNYSCVLMRRKIFSLFHSHVRTQFHFTKASFCNTILRISHIKTRWIIYVHQNTYIPKYICVTVYARNNFFNLKSIYFVCLVHIRYMDLLL